MKEAGPYLFPETETAARELGISFDRDRITCQEMLFNVTEENGGAWRFLEIWDQLSRHHLVAGLPLRHPIHGGTGEGVAIGIAACGSGLTFHGSEEMDRSLLSRVFWHCSLDFRWRFYHRFSRRIAGLIGVAPRADLGKSAFGSSRANA